MPALDENRVFGVWLQRRVLFEGDDGTVWGVGDADRALGPDAVLVETNNATLRGKFHVYDSDYVDANNRGSLLESSADLVVTQGDVWHWDA